MVHRHRLQLTFNSLFVVVTVDKIDANRTRCAYFDWCDLLGRVTTIQSSISERMRFAVASLLA